MPRRLTHPLDFFHHRLLRITAVLPVNDRIRCGAIREQTSIGHVRGRVRGVRGDDFFRPDVKSPRDSARESLALCTPLSNGFHRRKSALFKHPRHALKKECL